MNTRTLRRLVAFVLSALLLIGIFALSGIVVAAQTPAQRRVIVVRPIRPIDPFGWRWRRYDRFNRYSDYVYQTQGEAYEDGYKDGQKTGKSDGKKQKSFDPERSHYFQEAGFGNFAEAYRTGFSRGYEVGYRDASIG